MIFGPCGGVRSGGECEMRPGPCTFAFTEPVEWSAPEVLGPTVAAPRVLTDLSVPPADPSLLATTVRALAGTCDAVLVGDHQDRPDFPPNVLARMIRDEGARPWVTLACRDRNRIGLEQELLALTQLDETVALCVTGDGRAYDVRPDVTQVFDLDGTRLAALAASMGVAAAVPETPCAPPISSRARRLVTKQRAGAGAAILNITESVGDVASFMAAARAGGLRIPVLAAVAVYTDERSASALGALPGLDLATDQVRRVLGAPDPVEAGIAAAVVQARALLAIEGIAGVNLSGLASARGAAFAAGVQAEIGRRIKALDDGGGS
jgi:methylenetetrahydrofolate reductase (NADPH)